MDKLATVIKNDGDFKENADLFRFAALLAFFEAGQDRRVQHPPQKKLVPCQTKNLAFPKRH